VIREALETLLACAQDQINTPVCRAFWNPGANAPHDSCGQTIVDGVVHDGQLWVAHLTSAAGWPSPTGDPITCVTPFSETVEIGIVRCARGVLQDDGQPPPASDVTADAQRQATDREALKQAILCCWGVEGRDLLGLTWEPIEPQGGCVGGIWTLTLRNASCRCPEDS
jgi:hypothetical protein